MPYIPTPEQVEDSDHMLEYFNAVCWNAAGTGKTLTAMEAIRKGEFEKVMIVCPKLALKMWAEELEFHLGLEPTKDVFVMRSGTPPRVQTSRSYMPVYQTRVLITTWDIMGKETFRRTCDKWLMGHQNPKEGRRHSSVLILDEHHMAKGALTNRYKSLAGTWWSKNKPAAGQGGVAGMFNSVWGLTGTPIVRHPDDLWAQLVILRPEILKHYGVYAYEDFVREFCTTKIAQYGNARPKLVTTGGKNHRRLRSLIASCLPMQRTLDEVVSSLPERTDRVVGVDYPKMSVEAAPLPDNLSRLASELNKPDSPLARVRRSLGMGKTADVINYAESLHRPGYPILIGFWHTDVGKEIAHNLQSVATTAMVNGSTPEVKREEYRDMFNAGKLDFLVGQMAAMNTAWNIQQLCRHVIIAEELLSPDMLHQFISRVHRRGQNHHVQVDHCRSEHPLDAAMVGIRDHKSRDRERLAI